jgi:hypothetical protein
VIGTRFDAELLASIGVDAVVDELVRAELIGQVKFTPTAEFAFRHPLIRTVAYESQLNADRATLHKRLATAIEQTGSADENAALIAEHLEVGGDRREAYSWRMRAGTWSTNRHLLVLRRCRGWLDRRAALVAELRVGRQLGAARPARQSRCCHRSATVPRDVHVSIVSCHRWSHEVCHIGACDRLRLCGGRST